MTLISSCDINMSSICSSRIKVTVTNTAITSCFITVIFLVAQVSTEYERIYDTGCGVKLFPLQTLDAGTFLGIQQCVADEDFNALPRTFYSFKGIPYAKAPLGIRRFKEPEVPDIRSQSVNTTVYQPPCTQWSPLDREVIGSQDCLYLNVFTPYIPRSPDKRPLEGNYSSWIVENPNLLPVLFYVHGGEFITGSGNQFGPHRLMKHNVILVTFNYRLGIFGFLSSEDENLPGNYGILDQVAALKWVYRNIQRFGGNRKRITVFGDIDYLLLSPRSRGLFHAAIWTPTTSSILSPVGTHPVKNPKDAFESITASLGCLSDDMSIVVECLQFSDVEQLGRLQQKMFKFSSSPRRFGPVVDADWMEYPVLPAEPDVLISNGTLPSVSLLIGVSAYEGFGPLAEFYAKFHPGKFKDMDTFKVNLLNTLYLMLGEEGMDFSKVFESIWTYYFSSIKKLMKEPERATLQLFRLFGDLTVYSGHRKLLSRLSKHPEIHVFNYVFNHSIDRFPNYLESKLEQMSHLGSSESLFQCDIPPWKELYYTFDPLGVVNEGRNFTDSYFTPEDYKMADILSKVWISFSYYGSPKQGVSKLPGFFKWYRISEHNLNYYSLRTEPTHMKLDFRKAEAHFWISTYPQVKRMAERIQNLETFPSLFWTFVALCIFLVIIICVLAIFLFLLKFNEGGFGEDNVVFLQHTRRYT